MFKKNKKLKKQVSNMYTVLYGLETQMEQARWHKDNTDISEDERKQHELIYKVLKYWYLEVYKALNGELKTE